MDCGKTIITASDSEGLPQLPHDLIVDILSRLPAKSLLKFKFVAKSWFETVTSRNFIATHLKISSTKDKYTNHWLIAQDIFHFKHCSLRNCLEESIPNATPIVEECFPHARIVGSCNGLVCVLNYGKIYLWNPTTKESTSKSWPDLCFEKYLQHFDLIYGFGYNEFTDDYNVVIIFRGYESNHEVNGRPHLSKFNDDNNVVVIYSLKTDSWRRIEDIMGWITFLRPGTFVNGKIHWESRSCNLQDWGIIYLDLSKDKHGKMEMPNFEEEVLFPRLTVLGGCLGVTCENHKDSSGSSLSLWIMKEYGVKDSWTKIVMKIPSAFSHPFCISSISKKGEKFVLFEDAILSMYDSENDLMWHKSIMNMSKCFFRGGATIYIESLVSPNTIGLSRAKEVPEQCQNPIATSPPPPPPRPPPSTRKVNHV